MSSRMKMKILTKDLIGPALDWAVAKCERYVSALSACQDVLIERDGVVDYFNPSVNWGWGGPIIERERISIRQWTNVPIVHAYMPQDNAPWLSDGTSPLVAAMRCFCSFKLGDEVDVPEELM